MAELLIATNNGIRTLTLNRTERLNAINDALSDQLIEALQSASTDDDVRVVVVTGEGRGFCAGLDLAEAAPLLLESSAETSRANRLDRFGWVGRLALATVNCDKPIVAAMNGIAAGAGLSLALACDFRLMAASAKLTTGYVRRALNPDAGMTYFLPRIVGYARAIDLILTSREVDATEAAEIGLVHQSVPDTTFQEAVLEFAALLASGPPLAMTLSKRLLVHSYETSLTNQLQQEFAAIKVCLESDDLREGLHAFYEKRKPEFRGK